MANSHHTIEVEDTTQGPVYVRVTNIGEGFQRYIDIERPTTGETIVTLYPTRAEALRLVAALLLDLL